MSRAQLEAVEVAKRDLIDGLITGIDVITAFNDDAARLSASELAEKITISRSAARRYLLTLVHIGLAATDGKSFWLTPKVLNLGRSYINSARLPRAIVPFLQRLTLQLQESSNYSLLEGDDVVYVSRVNAPRLLTTGFEPGTRLPAYTSTAGRVLLAALSELELQTYLARVELVAYTHLTVTDKTVLAEELATIREQGFAVTENQFEIGLRGISVPLKNRRGMLVGALSISMMIASSSKAEASARCLPALQAAANTMMQWV
ncbi:MULTISPECIES: IclR family transcriptional regulator domain-containing protein [unclassified Undibacterium]|uniref:IclR family transcriptional regulator domain-containing protein n=1 Tax=unclassified Undibacterium TaxID=2630295 RepID=UPI002AC936D0|nr:MULTISPECIES: IclR family transcriptional regulator C-terminal domain-containing protein [unclassified Undibacterium]MEB0138442.1 IclR family transcriptional regulator C-terminal domain-containing protein [Undibacterium sp. CCC2.1]MEB0171317.1 IclR family transcriptional regulator C-terminal domain-containing protein [Undibacterium sp. CCC1.1]MEB0176446.1 IclR family transcriptional regulator C-terminal domain-containing protein [Undibacterium sp. CCC3.4]MEB0214071.1 IclR family transcriptio